MFGRKLLLMVCALLSLLPFLTQAASATDTGFEPIKYWSVPDSFDPYTHRFPDPLSALRAGFPIHWPPCSQSINGYGYTLVAAKPIPGPYYVAYDNLFNGFDCSTGQNPWGLQESSPVAFEYVGCPGQSAQWFHSEAQLWQAMYGTTKQRGCFPGYGIVKSRKQPPPVGCPTCQKGGKKAGDPIDIATGNMYERETDYVSADPRLRYSRVYNSSLSSTLSTAIGKGWMGELDGSHIITSSGVFPFAAVLTESSMYASPSDACTQGVYEIATGGGDSSKADPEWAGVTAVYDGAGHCNLSNGTSVQVIGSTSADGILYPFTGFARSIGVRRPDGSRYAFTCLKGVCTPPAGAGSLPFTVTADSDGYSILDEDGITERYDYLGFLKTLTYKDGYQLILTYSNEENNAALVADGSDMLASIADNHGRAITFGYDIYGQLSTLSTPDGQTITYNHDPASGQLTSVVYPTGTRTYQYTNASFPNNLTGILDENGNVLTTWSYDANGLANGSVNGGTVITGGINAVSLIFNGGSTIETDALGTQRTYTFSSTLGFPQISSIAGPLCHGCGLGASNTYDSNGYLASSTDWNGHVTGFTFDAAGELHQRVDGQGTPQSRTTTINWNDVLHNPTDMAVADASGTALKSAWTYNARGEPLKLTRTDPNNNATRVWTYTYCEQANIDAGTCPLLGLLTSVDGPRTDVSDVTTYKYFASDDSGCATPPSPCTHRKGDLQTITDALGHVTTFLSYDGAGRPRSLKNPNNVQVDLLYWPRGWLEQVAVRANSDGTPSSGDEITSYTYDNVGNLQQVTQPDSSSLSFTYDPAHRLTDIADNLGDKIHYTLDAAGNRLQEDTRDPSGALKHSVVRQFNALGQLAATLNADGSTVNGSYHYDPNGNLDVVTDGRGTVTNNSYDAFNRLYHVDADPGVAPQHVDANIDYTLDALDRVRRVIDPQGLHTDYGYDGLSNPTTLGSPDTGTTNATVFDAAGNVKTRKDARGITVTYTYDALGRVKTVKYPTTALNVTYVYDTTQAVCNQTTQAFGIGRLTSITDGSGNTRFCYDRFGNMVKKQQIINGTTFITNYVYNLAHRLTQVTTPAGTVIAYTRDGIGRVTKVTYKLSGGTTTTLVKAVTYYPFGPVASITYNNNRVLTRSYDLDYVVNGVKDSATDGLYLGFLRDPIGNLTQVTSGQAGNQTGNILTYDPLNRLKNVNDLANNAVWTYGYDATGNRLSHQQGTGSVVPYTYPTTSHELAAVGSTLRGYDAMGNTTSIGTGATAQVFHYNDTGRMDQLLDGTGAVKMQYATNALGQRVEKYLAGNSAATQYAIRDEAGEVMAEYDSNSARVREMVWMDGMPVGVLTGMAGNLAYLEPDQLGTPRAAIDGTSNTRIWSWPAVNDPFGQMQPTGTLSLDLRFPGQAYDAESGMNYNGRRDFDPASGRYIESDPMGLLAGISTYAYSHSTPIMASDASGLEDTTVTAWCRQNPVDCIATFGPPIASAGIRGLLVYAVSKACIQTIFDWTHSHSGEDDNNAGVTPAAAAAADGANAAGGAAAPPPKEPNNNAEEPGSSPEEPNNSGDGNSNANGPSNPPSPGDFTNPNDLPGGWEWRGKGEPGSRNGAYYNPSTDESMHNDTTHPAGKDPHWTYTDPQGVRWDNFGSGWTRQ